MNSDSPDHSPQPADPRLRSFLRQASAIIATEKGMNAVSQAKLQSLADHLNLPRPLFEEALVQLHATRGSAELTRYEKAFLKFIASEFERLRGDVLSVEMEKKAVDLAKHKFQISETRAEQLIQSQTEAIGISRISPEEAIRFGEQSIAKRIGKSTTLDEDALQRLAKIGKTWGLDADQVQRIIHRQFIRNRVTKAPSRKRVRNGMLAVLTMLILGAAVSWFAGIWDRGPSEHNPILPEQHALVSPSPSGIQSSWLSNATQTRLLELIEIDSKMKPSIDDIQSKNSDQRYQGYVELTRVACAPPTLTQSRAAAVISGLYFEEPINETAIAVLDVIGSFLRGPLEKERLSVEDLKGAYRANQLLGEIYVNPPSDSINLASRREAVQSTLQSRTGILMDSSVSSDVYLQITEHALAGDLWNRLAEMAWLNPSQASQLIQPLIDLTEDKLAPETLCQYRDETVLAIIESDPTHWKKILKPIQLSIATCGETNLIQWIDLFASSNHQDFQDNISTALQVRIGLSPDNRSRDELVESIVDYGTRYRHRILSPALDRSQMLDIRFANCLKPSVDDLKSVPNQIANLVLAVNIEMAFCSAIQNASHITESSFVDFDRLTQTPKLILRDVISLPIDRIRSEGFAKSSMTASDKRRKSSALETLGNLTPDSAAKRQRELIQLKQVARRIDDISYPEAELLANYFLADTALNESLNIQRLIGAFSHWPTLATALADRILVSDVDQEKATMLARLLLRREVSSGEAVDWRRQLAVNILAVVESDLVYQTDLDPNNSESEWERLRLFLVDSCNERLEINSIPVLPNRSYTLPHQPTIDLVKSWNLKNRRVSINQEFNRAVSIVAEISNNEIEQNVFANQLLMRVIADQISLNSESAKAEQLLDNVQESLQNQSLPGNQLLETEETLLRLMVLLRQSLIERLQLQRN